MNWIKKIVKWLLYFSLFLVIIIVAFCVYVYSVADVKPPIIKDMSIVSVQRNESDSTIKNIGNNSIQKNKYGLYEMYIKGNSFERGVLFGKLAKELVQYQELAFTNEIQRMIPSKKYLKFLKYVVGFMNRDLSDYVIKEYQEEIYGISLSASEEFNWIGTNYSRQLNYHAAHDIGHALANMMLVGCTSFATWNGKSVDSQLIIGRNFDFYVGDEFAKNKIVAFYKPEKGIPYISVTWGGFIGVVSGMNSEGLTVTINANKSSIPYGAATPVSLVAREILQYASTIDEAYAIAKKRKMFVSESFLIGSAKDNKAVVIEKTPTEISMYDAHSDNILCANHYQSKLLENQELNQTQIKNSASLYRYQHLQELIDNEGQNTPQKTAQILRNFKGKNNIDIGLTNEKAINQFICHHSIIFEPKKGLVWVSTTPFQMGKYICYNINEIFSAEKLARIPYEENLTIEADSVLKTSLYVDVEKYLKLEKQFQQTKEINPNELQKCNPNYYDTYRIMGDYYFLKNEIQKANENYKKALTLEIATQEEKESILKKIK